MNRPRRPTDVGLASLRVLWEQGDSAVRTVHEALGSKDAPATILTETGRIKLFNVLPLGVAGGHGADVGVVARTYFK